MTNREKDENYAIRIREEYSPKGESDIDALRKLDKKGEKTCGSVRMDVRRAGSAGARRRAYSSGG